MLYHFPTRDPYWTEEDSFDSMVYVTIHHGQLLKADTLPLLWAAVREVALGRPLPTAIAA